MRNASAPSDTWSEGLSADDDCIALPGERCARCRVHATSRPYTRPCGLHPRRAPRLHRQPRGWRNVALDPQTVATLRAHRKRQVAEQLAFGPAYEDRGLVFCREDGTPIHPDRASKLFAQHVKAAGLPRIRLHDLRHTHATLALAAGVHPKVVSERLGHSSIAIMLDTYSHAIPALQEEAASAIAALIQ